MQLGQGILATSKMTLITLGSKLGSLQDTLWGQPFPGRPRMRSRNPQSPLTTSPGVARGDAITPAISQWTHRSVLNHTRGVQELEISEMVLASALPILPTDILTHPHKAAMRR